MFVNLIRYDSFLRKEGKREAGEDLDEVIWIKKVNVVSYLETLSKDD